ncbi:MAG: hypothetical protein M3336_11530 [Chloroflexota bacterium]|nr:hypothetical protein [Chloroflexota bacterium]
MASDSRAALLGSCTSIAGVGILVGIGFYFPAVLAAALTLDTLSISR